MHKEEISNAVLLALEIACMVDRQCDVKISQSKQEITWWVDSLLLGVSDVAQLSMVYEMSLFEETRQRFVDSSVFQMIRRLERKRLVPGRIQEGD